MNLSQTFLRGLLCLALWTCLLSETFPCAAQSDVASSTTNTIRIVELQGAVEFSTGEAGVWRPAQANQIIHPLDHLRTGPNSRVALRWSDQSVVPFGASTELEILLPHEPNADSGLHLIRGILSFFHRDKPGRIRVVTRGAVAGIEGTEFVLAVNTTNATERTTLSVIDGKVRFGNEQATLVLTNGEQAIADVGQAPVRTAGFIANNLLQWCFYYPGVLDPAELPLTTEEQHVLAESLAAYRTGDLLTALAKYPPQAPDSPAVRVYRAALELSVGQVEPAQTDLNRLTAANSSDRILRLAAALRLLIAAVQNEPNAPTPQPQLTTELLAASYYEQSHAVPEVSLTTALYLARRATTNSPDLGFAWERVAELEFSFGRINAARAALDKSLALAPRNAQALALNGFLLAAQNRTYQAVVWFDRALATDSSLANAWLGRGLCRIRQGNDWRGREDLLVAAALEPRRSELRSYLGKAYTDNYDFKDADRELRIARELDPQDPTALLYSALLRQQQNRINEAIGDLEQAQALNDNRSVYRSSLLLDQDQAVRSVSLAKIYNDAGMDQVSLLEASRAVSYDYANFSAHLFLAGSFDQLSDPNEINLRFNVPAVSEYFIANLLAPVGAGPLSQTISQQEYSKLFEQDGFHIASSTEYLSRGAWTQNGAQYGVFGNFSYDVEAEYRSDPGQFFNNDFEERTLTLRLKQQLTPQDTAYLEVSDYQKNTGDVGENYANVGDPNERVNEDQRPNVALGYNHEWAPGVHTLFLAGRFTDDYTLQNATVNSYFFNRSFGYSVPAYDTELFYTMLNYHNSSDVYTAEAQQIWEVPDHTTIMGARYQTGEFQTADVEYNPSFLTPIDPFFQSGAALALQDFHQSFERVNAYGYHYWQILPSLQLAGGLAYDRVRYPENYNSPPISDEQTHISKVSPKAGFIWQPLKNTTARFAFTRSLGGPGLTPALSLEPSQVAGINQSFRSILPESVGGNDEAPRFETFGLSLEQKFDTRTYLTLSGQILNSEANGFAGAYQFDPSLAFSEPFTTPFQRSYRERELLVSANQLLGKEWAVGADYELILADLYTSFNQVPDEGTSVQGFPSTVVGFIPRQKLAATLHRAALQAIYNHPSGFFAQFQALWYQQNSEGYNITPVAGDEFWQLNLYGGYRFLGRHAELRLGVLNLTDQDYNLNPLTLYNELPHARTFAARFQFSF